MRIYGLLLVVVLAGNVAAQDSTLQKKDVLLYEPCESLESSNPGVKDI